MDRIDRMKRSHSGMPKAMVSLALALSCVSISQAPGAAETGVAYVSTASGVAVIDLAADEASGDVAVIDSANLGVARRVSIGKNPEFMRMQPDGDKAYVTFEPSSSGKPPGKAGKDDDSGAPAEVAAIDLHTWTARS